MAEYIYGIGLVVCTIGGFLLCLCILCLIGFGLNCAWIAFSESFRDICKAESLIHDYRKNREKFLEWRDGEENMWKGRMEDLYGH